MSHISLQNERVAVIGATGFIGSHLTQRLLSRGCEVLAIARSADRLSNLGRFNGHFRFASCDVQDREGLLAVLADFGPRYVFHLAAHPDGQESFSQIASSVRVNTMGTMNAVEAAALSGAERLVLSDSCKVYGQCDSLFHLDTPVAPICSYAVAKSAAWQLCDLAMRLTAMQVVALRPSFIYGARQNFNLMTHVADCLLKNRPVRLLGGSQTRDPLFIDDAVSAFLAAAVMPGAHSSAIPIGGGREYTVVELCRAVMHALDCEVGIEENAFPPRLTEIWRMCADNSDALRILGWAPAVPLHEGLRRTFALHEYSAESQPGRLARAAGVA